jgi:hypothetical protein
MVYVLSKISDFSLKRTAMAMAADVLLIWFGYLSHFTPGVYTCESHSTLAALPATPPWVRCNQVTQVV